MPPDAHTHTVIEGVIRVKQSTLHQVLRVVDENECVAMEMEEEADMLSQLQGKRHFLSLAVFVLFWPLLPTLCFDQ